MDNNQRFILLNRLISVSKTRASYDPPPHGAAELLQIIDNRRKQGLAIEFEGLREGEDSVDEKLRISNGAGHNFLRLTEMKWEGTPAETRYVTLLFEHVNQDLRRFPVVHTTTFKGREIEGDAEERGATAAHLVVQIPKDSALDLGNYRCAIEAISPITRTAIEKFLTRQLRRKVIEDDGWTFTVMIETGRGKRPKSKEFRYVPKLELHADVGRKFSGSLTDGQILASMVFTKRKERRSIGRPAEVAHDDFEAQVGFGVTSAAPVESVVADVEIKVNANQGPPDATERRSWASGVRRYFEGMGYETKLYFRHAVGGPMFAGEVHPAIAGAADLIICPKEVISLSESPKQWRPEIDPETVEKMKEILNTDSLWEHAE